MFEIKQKPLTEDLMSQIDQGLRHHSIEMVGHDGKHDPISFTINYDEELVGALVVTRFWGALYINKFYVDKKYRGQGLGKKLMNQALDFGKQHNCSLVYVETMSFQSLKFYQKCGFELDFTREGYSNGISIHYLHKKL